VEDQLHERLVRELDEAALRHLDPEEARHEVMRAARQLASEMFPRLVGDAKDVTLNHVADEVLGLGPIEPLVRDPTVSEIMVNAPAEVYVERDGVISPSDVVFRDEAHIRRVIDRIVVGIGRHVDEASPMVDARLADGSRVNIIIPPLVPRSPVITIRKFRGDRYTMVDLVRSGTASEGIARLLEAAVGAKLNVVVAGGAGTGKTTLLNALSSFIPRRERIVTIEDPIELKLQQRHVIAMEARPASTEGRGEVTQRDLVRNALRMRPDRIIVGEVRGGEAFDMMQAMNTGHEGSLTTVHANSARDALARIENMILMAGFELPVAVIREQMASSLHLFVHLVRLTDGARRIAAVTEVAGIEGNVVALQDLLSFRQTGIGPDGAVTGEFRPTGVRSRFAERLEAHGLDLSTDLFGVSKWA